MFKREPVSFCGGGGVCNNALTKLYHEFSTHTYIYTAWSLELSVLQQKKGKKLNAK